MYDFKVSEEEILKFWDENDIYPKLKKRNSTGKKFYFLQGPPYTSGYLHLGQAWNEGMKDMVLRYKRMQGLNVWDRGGFDMHGLPTARKVQAAENLEDKEAIEKYGVEKFVNKCIDFSLEKAEQMMKDLWRLGVWLDHSNPYMPINNSYIEAVWWLVKRAHDQGRLYEGLRTIHWDVATGSAVAKHELEYQSVKDTAIYIKFKRKGKDNSYFLAFTTTPWTIPLNLAIMVHPELGYVEVEMETESGAKENWVLAKSLLETVMEKAKVENFRIINEFKGETLDGEAYEHPLNTKDLLPTEVQEAVRLFTVVLSSEYVTDAMGTGLVHCAPGCGPEDYEVGHHYHIPPFNCVNEQGLFENFGPYTNWKARVDDSKFVQDLEDKDVLIIKESYVHDYPHGERSHEAVIFRTTKQWFFKVEDLKEEMLKENAKVYWRPQAAKNAFNSWLENLRDNSITKQRYWGSPVPIWINEETGDYIVIGSVEELESYGVKAPENLHKPWIDDVVIEKDGKKYTRIPDILDVWIDAGAASWACLDYPQNDELIAKYFPVDFILEGKDQIRGWFNLLMVASIIGFKKNCFQNVYMHGFVTDVSGIKMSKSIGNVISPYELIDKHGADAMRFYMTGANAGEDINFSWNELKLKYKNLLIMWNIHKYLLDYCRNTGVKSMLPSPDQLGLEEKYILSKLHSTIKDVTNHMEKYEIDLVPKFLENLFLELSRTYIQYTRDKINEKPEVVLGVIYEVLFTSLKLSSILTPYITEKMFLNIKEAFGAEEESIHHYMWPKVNESMIDETLENSFKTAESVLQAALAARDKAKIGVRWPLQKLTIVSSDENVATAIKSLKQILLKHVNIKELEVLKKLEGGKVTVEVNKNSLGKEFKQDSAKIIPQLTKEKMLEVVSKGSIDLDGFTITKEHLKIKEELPEGLTGSTFTKGSVYIDTKLTPELETEGYAREVTRRVQQMRKDEGMEKKDRINLSISADYDISSWKEDIQSRVGADSVAFEKKEHLVTNTFEVKGQKFTVSFEKL